LSALLSRKMRPRVGENDMPTMCLCAVSIWNAEATLLQLRVKCIVQRGPRTVHDTAASLNYLEPSLLDRLTARILPVRRSHASSLGGRGGAEQCGAYLHDLGLQLLGVVQLNGHLVCVWGNSDAL
jgi:hypothetical protein